MKHLIIFSEYPPAPGGGIGTHVWNMARLLADSGETIHVIGQLWKGAEQDVEEYWRWPPLVSHEVIVKLIGETTTSKWLEVKAPLAKRRYPVKMKLHKFHGEWNYSISP